MDNELYEKLVKNLDQIEDAKQQYDDLHRETITHIAKLLDVPAFILTLEIIPPYEGDHVDYVHKLTISTVQLPVDLTLRSINEIAEFVETNDMELHPKRDKLVLTYTQDYDPAVEQEKDDVEDSYDDYDLEDDEESLLL